MASKRRSFPVAPLLLVTSLAAGLVGCGGGSSQLNCPPVVSGDVSAQAPRVDAGVDASANAAVEPPRADARLREAAELRARAKVNIDAGRLREALPDLERAFELSGDVTILGDLGLSLQAAGRLDEAWLALHRFRAEARAAYEPVRVKIDAALGDLSGKLGGLVVESALPGAVVLVRGQIVASLPMASPIYLAPGDVSVVLRARGRADVTVRARVAVGAVARANADLNVPGVGVAAGGLTGTVGGLAGGLGKPVGGLTGAVGGIAAPVGGITGSVGGITGPGVTAPNPGLEVPNPNLTAPSVGNVTAPAVGAVGTVGAVAAPTVAAVSAPIWPIVVGGLGLAVVGGSIAASVVHSGRLDNFDANLCGKSGASVECPTIESGIKVTTGLQVVGYILGAAALTTGIVVFAVSRSAPELECPKVGRAPAFTLKCAPGADNKGGGVGCVGTF